MNYLSASYATAARALASVALLLWLEALNAAPLRLIKLPLTCDVVVIKSLETNGYLGVSRPYSDQSALLATYNHNDPESRFVVNYFGSASGPMALTVKLSNNTADKRHLLLGFNGSTGVMKAYTYGNYSSNKQPSNTLLMLGGWPITNQSFGGSAISLQAGPYFRLYLRNDAAVDEARAVAGVDGTTKQVVLNPMDTAADMPNVPFVNPATLFFIEVVSSPGSTACLRMT